MDDFDIDRSTARAWREFRVRLSEIISMIDDSADLTIGTAKENDDAGPYVRLSSPRRDVIRCEAAGNAELGDDFHLDEDQMATMRTLGWSPPAAEPPDGNFWFELPQEESDWIAELCVAALRDVYRVQHPVFLAPDQLADLLQPSPAPLEPAGGESAIEVTGPVSVPVPRAPANTPVSVDREDLRPTMPRDRDHLDRLVDAELSEMFGYPPLRDAEGDVVIRVGSTMLFLRTPADGQEVVVFAAVVHDVAGRSRAAEVLNDLNVEARWVKFQLVKDRVFVTLSVPARPFVPAHLHHAVRILSDVADGIDDELAAKLGGRTTFKDYDGTR